jgi:hypothetical protein
LDSTFGEDISVISECGGVGVYGTSWSLWSYLCEIIVSFPVSHCFILA